MAGEMPRAKFTAIFDLIVTEQLLGYEPSMVAGAKITYVKLNTPMPSPPHGTCPRSTAGAPAASFIGDVPCQNWSRDATAQAMSR